MRSAIVVMLALLAPLAQPTDVRAQRARVDLDGEWRFSQDPRNQGEAEGWATSGGAFTRTLVVPGAWQAQGVGEPKGTLRHDYAGVAWYRRTVTIPAAWRGQAVTLRIGGAHREVALFVNGRKIGEHDGFSAPFSFDVSDAIRAGADNVIALRIANPGAVPLEGPREQKPVRPTGMLNYIGNWGGVYGHVELRAAAPTSIEQVYVRPDVERRIVRLVVTVRNRETRPFAGEVAVTVAPQFAGRAAVQVQPGGQADVEVTVAIPGAQLWSPERPHLYTAAIVLRHGGREQDRLEERFGMRQITTRSNVLLLNGTPLYLRGYGDDNIEVLTGFPPASRDVYRQRLKQAKDFGFNAVRFHSMTPPEDLFHAADEVGLLVMAELPAAYTQYVLPHRDLLRRELHDVVLAYRNRPSLLSVAFGNEFNLSWLETDTERKTFLDTVADFYQLAKSLHPDGLFLSNDGYVMRPTDLVSHYGDGVRDLPVVKHEFGEYYCSLPDVSLLDRFTGVFLPGWLHTKSAWIATHALADRYPQYVRNSQRLQQLGRKYQIERVRRRQDITGYHYWLIVDFPGGTGEGDSWEEGWFDYFWQPKGITPADGQAINGAVVSLIDVDVADRTFWNDQRRTVPIVVSNYGERDLTGARLTWKVLADGQTVASETARIDVPMGKVSPVATAALPVSAGSVARKLDLIVSVEGAHPNTWSFWSFPRGGLLDRAAIPVYSAVKWAGVRRLYPFVREERPQAGGGGLLVTSRLDETAMDHLRDGGRVWLMAQRGQTQTRSEVSFFPAAGGALGSVIRSHGALDGFPHDGFADLQFYNLMDGAAPIPLDRWPADLEPLVGAIRTTAGFLSKSKDLSRGGYVFEATVGRGRLLVTSLRFRDHFDEAYPEVIHLFDRLLRYASGPGFAPAVEAGAERLQMLMPPR
jgi:beta-galactosidase